MLKDKIFLILTFIGFTIKGHAYNDQRFYGKNRRSIEALPWPYMVAILDANDHEFICGGTLIAAQHIVTSAHSFQKVHKESIVALVGEAKLTQASKLHKIAKIKLHEDFKSQNDGSFVNDIALLELAESLPLDEDHQVVPWPVEIPSNNLGNAKILSWKNPRKLVRAFDATVEDCNENESNLNLCSKTLEHDSCNQETPGGPLLCEVPYWNGPIHVICGVVSHHYCASSTHQSVHVSIMKYKKWITRNIRESIQSQTPKEYPWPNYIALDTEFTDHDPNVTCSVIEYGSKEFKPCSFPFLYKGQTYDACTTDDENRGIPWCSTMINETTRIHTGGLGLFGYCTDPKCPKEADCIWGQWTEWYPCSETCGEGVQFRARHSMTPMRTNCKILDSEVQSCNQKACPSSSRIMITTGSHLNSERTEVIDISNPGIRCNDMQDFPMTVEAATGGFSPRGPLICGGRNTYKLYDKCFLLFAGQHAKSLGKFKFRLIETELVQKRSHASSVFAKGGNFHIFGGGNGMGKIASMESISPNGNVIRTPISLNMSSAGSCSLNFESNILITGDKSTYIFSPTTGTIKEGPKMDLGFTDHGCAAFNSPLHDGRRVIVVAGGLWTSRKAQILDVEGTQRWQSIPDLPKEMPYRPVLLETPNGNGTFILYGRDIYELACTKVSCRWSKKPQQMKVPRHYFVAMYVPHDETRCDHV